MHKIYRFLLLTLVLLSFNIYADNSDELLQKLLKNKPKPGSYVNDDAQVISVARRQQIEAVSQELRQKTGAVIVLVTLPSLQGGSLEDFSVKLAHGWGIGESDQGILILFALKDKKVRIEVGYGLEHILNDAKTGRIIRENMVPYFKQQSYASGLLNGSAAVATTIAQAKGVQLTGNQQLYNRNSPAREPTVASRIFGFLFLIFVVFMFIKHPQLMLLLLLSGRGGRGGSGGFGGGGGGFGGGGFGGGGASGSW
jgi:uncharacterized protein